jgi:hypothetical protein
MLNLKKGKSLILIIVFSLLQGMVAMAQVDKTIAKEKLDSSSGESYYRDIYPDTWVGTDALERNMPTYKEVGPPKKDQRRVVGIFYVTWHRDKLHNSRSPYTADVTKILAKDPSARLDTDHPLWKYSSYHWGEPEAGYFLSKDRYVIRKDMSMLADAGVDVLIMDVTNAVRYWDEWETIFSVMEKMRAEGNKVPKFCFWAFNGPVITVVQELYDRIYKKEKYKDLWFYWKGKPLLLYNDNPGVDAASGNAKNPNPHFDPSAKTDPNNPHYKNPDYTQKFYKDYTQDVKDFFTLRTMWWGYYEWGNERFVGTEDNWSFGYDLGNKEVRNMDTGDLVSTHNGRKEQAAVTPAQHPSSLVGKSWTRENGEPELNKYDLPESVYVPWLEKEVKHPERYGIYFQQRWNEALKADPPFIYINDWNEWTAGKYSPGKGETTTFMGRQSKYFFVDQYNAEFNRGIQPMKDRYTDNYYMQMAQNIRRYKGARPIPKVQGFSRINIDGNFADWDKVEVEYRDTKGDTFHRDYDGYGGLHYTNSSGRNDIVTSKVAVDNSNIYFYAETNNKLTPHTGNNWMMLLIDSDQNYKTGWYGYDYLINKKGVGRETTTLMQYSSTNSEGNWTKIAKLNYRYNGKKLEIGIPRDLIGLKENEFTFDFHWSDNPADLKNPISLSIDGDSAPNRRFNYRCIWKGRSK